MSLHKIMLDARELDHPIPLEMAIKAIHTLDAHNYLYMLHRKNPLPLLDLAKEHQFQVLSQEDNREIWHILIAKDNNINLNDLLDV